MLLKFSASAPAPERVEVTVRLSAAARNSGGRVLSLKKAIPQVFAARLTTSTHRTFSMDPAITWNT